MTRRASARVRLCVSSAAIGIALTGAQAARAQSDQPPPDPAPTPEASTARSVAPGGPDDIVVTARRRSETLQEVPIAVSAVSGERILNAGLTRAGELQSLVPNLTVNGAFGVTNPQIFIRGIGNNDYNDNAGAAVGVYVDDVYIASPAAKLVQMFDLESVQVFRGPQGTLFGKNNTAGAIVLTSKRPGNDVEGYAKATAGNYATVNFEGAVTVPLAPDLSIRIAIQRNSRGGYARNLNIDGSLRDKVGALDELALRGILRYSPGALDAVLTVNYSRTRDDRAPGKSTGLGPNGSNSAGFIDPYPNDPRINYANYKEIENANTRGANLNVSYDLGFAKLTSISAYIYADRFVTLDSDKSPFNLLNISRRPKSNEYSQELRLSSVGSHAFEWVAGLYYLREDLKVNTLFAFGGATIPFYPQNYTSDTRTAAAFAEGIFHLNDRLSVTGGIRYTTDKRLFGIVVGPGGNAIPQTNLSRRWNNVSWRAIVDYKLSPNNILYASVSRGFQGGGFNGGAFSLAELGNGYNPEYVTAYEGGIKTSFFDNKLTFNVGGFYYDYKDPQVFTLNGGQTGQAAVGLVQTITNAKGATIKGLEFETRIRPTPTWTFSGSVGLLDSKYKDLFLLGPNNTVINGRGNQLISAPKLTFEAGITKIIETDIGRFSLRADTNYQSRRYFSINEQKPISGAPYAIVNANVTYTIPSGRADVGLWVRNLTDNAHIVFNGDLAAYQYIESFYNPPRTYGMEATIRF